ncbi:hypothetical protein E1212_15620 [Jiangella ureilytica]|uniref:Heparinase n=1 Tax=Jiangella ureilytica TaxID=2530374 RepID=A0A4R4RPC1_9ACTN|nr:hypothetical protein [Jiangella ureilytica]TDC50323.1 hypothetical protein E1212_15620 [Jiangella ureilytica]
MSFRARVVAGMLVDAETWAARPVDDEWIAPVADDPLYENLYDRFWAIMADAAVLEHLALTAQLTGSPAVTEAAVARLDATARRWRREAEPAPDYGTAYATTRVAKALAVGSDCLAGALPPSVRDRVLEVLTTITRRLAAEWFTRPDVRGPVGTGADRHSPHHSSVEWSGFGIAALALLDRVPEAAGWVTDAERQFRDHLLPGALAADGAAPEGMDFWASTVLSQVQFLDPLRRVTGRDLLTAHARSLDPTPGLAVYLPRRTATADGHPHYGPSTGLCAVLSALARERAEPQLAAVAAQEAAPGRLEVWPARSPRRGEQLLMAWGGYAALWHPGGPDGDAVGPPPALSWYSPTLGEAYVRSGWGPGSFVVAVRRGRVTAWADGVCALADLTPEAVIDVEESRRTGSGVYRTEPPGLEPAALRVIDLGDTAVVTGADAAGRPLLRVSVDRPRRTATILRIGAHPRRWWWATPSAPAVGTGTVTGIAAGGHRPDLRAGYGLLDVVETDPRAYPVATVEPDAGRIEVAVQLGKNRPGGSGAGGQDRWRRAPRQEDTA